MSDSLTTENFSHVFLSDDRNLQYKYSGKTKEQVEVSAKRISLPSKIKIKELLLQSSLNSFTHLCPSAAIGLLLGGVKLLISFVFQNKEDDVATAAAPGRARVPAQ